MSLEGMSRMAFRVAKELAQNSRSGLTVRFLSKKLEIPPEEVEYLVDVNHRILFIDLTRVKLVPEGHSAVKRIITGLENHGDAGSLFRMVKSLEAHEFRRFEERVGIDKPGGKKAAAEQLLARWYRHPDSVVDYVATRGFSGRAQELFDFVWQSKDGVVPVARLHGAHEGDDFSIEQGLWELFQSFALFEMFRFDSEDRLVRMAGLLSELRQAREKTQPEKKGKAALRPVQGNPFNVDCRALALSDRVCRLIASIAAKPVRLRSDGELFREDRRRLEEMGADDEPSLATCLWLAEGVGWLARVDNELRVNKLDELIKMDRLARQRHLFDWVTSQGNEAASRRTLAETVSALKPGAWYPVLDFIEYTRACRAEDEQPILRNSGGHWRYVSASAASNTERGLARSLEEAFLWLGVVDRAEEEGGNVFRVSELGLRFLSGADHGDLAKLFPERCAKIIVQPNFDIVVPLQDVDPLLTVPLDQFAERASTGQATVYRLTKESFTKALQEGHDGDAFVAFLLAHNREPELPSNVVTTLDDWRGSVKRVRVRTLHVVETDDPLVMADLAHRRRFAKYFQEIDSKRTIAYSKISKAKLLKELEKDGFVIG